MEYEVQRWDVAGGVWAWRGVSEMYERPGHAAKHLDGLRGGEAAAGRYRLARTQRTDWVLRMQLRGGNPADHLGHDLFQGVAGGGDLSLIGGARHFAALEEARAEAARVAAAGELARQYELVPEEAFAALPAMTLRALAEVEDGDGV